MSGRDIFRGRLGFIFCGGVWMNLSMKLFLVLTALLICVIGMNVAAGALNTKNNYLRGDADGDGIVGINDVTTIQRHMASLENVKDNNRNAADVDGDGIVSINDATLIQRYLAMFGNDCAIDERITDQESRPDATQSVSWNKPGDNELPFVPN